MIRLCGEGAACRAVGGGSSGHIPRGRPAIPQTARCSGHTVPSGLPANETRRRDAHGRAGETVGTYGSGGLGALDLVGAQRRGGGMEAWRPRRVTQPIRAKGTCHFGIRRRRRRFCICSGNMLIVTAPIIPGNSFSLLRRKRNRYSRVGPSGS